jgi:hypothetical protein
MREVPNEEVHRFLATLGHATGLALRGQAVDGYAGLLAGLHRAAGAAEAGEFWSAAVIRQYREVLDRFADRWNIGRG